MTTKTQSISSSRDQNHIFGDVTFYGILTDIIELDYSSGNRVVLFKCNQIIRSGIKKEKDCTIVNISRLMNDNEPFILASQAKQLMYVEDLKNKGWHVALKMNPRDQYDISVRSNGDNVESYQQVVSCTKTIDVENENISLVRTDMQGISIDSSLADATGVIEEDEEL